MKRRTLKPDELELWKRVTDQTRPLDLPQARTSLVKPPGHESAKLTKGRPPLPPLVRRPTSPPPRNDLAPSLPDHFGQAPLRMDKKTYAALKRGKARPEGRIDLHGMTLDRAHPALLRFVLGAHASGKRLVLVITGKGKNRDEGGPIPVRYGVLRHQVPQWLAMAPLSSVVLQVTPAHISHGGGGAYYIYLKRQR